jgi:hypothetical protein
VIGRDRRKSRLRKLNVEGMKVVEIGGGLNEWAKSKCIKGIR